MLSTGGTSGRRVETAKKVNRRTITGCMTCRKRRKKCDEEKPICGGCRRNYLQCNWPDYNNGRLRRPKRRNNVKSPEKVIPNKEERKTSLDFHVTYCPLDARVKPSPPRWIFQIYSLNGEETTLSKFDHLSSRFIPVDDFQEDSPVESISANEDGNPLNVLGSVDEEFWSSLTISETLDLQLDSFSIPLIDIPRHALVIHPSTLSSHYQVFDDPNAEESIVYEKLLQKYRNNELPSESVFKHLDMEAFLFFACLKGYIPKLSTQYTHPSLTADATFIPQVEKHPLMKRVFLCCGATYLAWKDLDRFQNLSDELYAECKSMVMSYIEENRTFADEDWLFASLQLLCNRDKNSFTGTVDDSIWHLSKAYLIIRQKYYDRRDTDVTENLLLNDFLIKSLILQPHERMFVESFIYHYSVSMLFAKDISHLPNPFTIFKALNVVLKCAVYNCEGTNEWMSNPLLGSSLDTFEILAKLSFIGRMEMPLGPLWLTKAMQLRNMCVYYTPPTPALEMDDIQWFNFKINSLVGILTTKTCDLFASKMIEFSEFDVNCAKVQKSVEEIVQCYKQIPADHQVWGILPWTMLIAGAFARDSDHQLFILDKINRMAERAHSYAGIKMSSFLHDIWSTPDGLNLLFNRERLAQVDV